MFASMTILEQEMGQSVWFFTMSSNCLVVGVVITETVIAHLNKGSSYSLIVVRLV